MYIFSYNDKLVLTDESLDLVEYDYPNMYGGSTYGGPRAIFNTWEELEQFLKDVFNAYVDMGIFNTWEELKQLFLKDVFNGYVDMGIFNDTRELDDNE